MYWPDTNELQRAYSLSSCALDRGAYEVTVKRDGKMGTRIVDWAKPGDKMFVIPPVGKFLPVLRIEQAFDLHRRRFGCDAVPCVCARSHAAKAGNAALQFSTACASPRTSFSIPNFASLKRRTRVFKFHVTCTWSAAGRQLDRPHRPHRLRLGQRARRRFAEHGFLRLWSEHDGGIC